MDKSVVQVGRRESSRRKACVPGSLLTSQRVHIVRIVDISTSGVRIELKKPLVGERGVLSWLGNKLWVSIAWNEDQTAGLAFDGHIDQSIVEETIAAFTPSTGSETPPTESLNWGQQLDYSEIQENPAPAPTFSLANHWTPLQTK